MDVCLCQRDQDNVCAQCKSVLFGRVRALVQIIREYQEKIAELQDNYSINCDRCFLDYGELSASTFIAQMDSFPQEASRMCVSALVEMLRHNGVTKFPHIMLEWNKLCARNGWSP